MPFTASPTFPSSAPPTPEGAFRLAHLTDVHLMPPVPPKGYGGISASAFQSAALAAKAQGAELLLLGGDIIMDAMNRSREEAEAQWVVAREALSQLPLPTRYILGNHDIWAPAASAGDPDWGKVWVMRELGLTARYYAFDLPVGWRVLALDSTFLTGQGPDYLARLDEAQFNWLAEQLAATPSEQPVMLLSHIPILSASVFLDGENERERVWEVPGSWMHLDARRIVELLAQYPNVRLALSGHLHLQDQVIYNGVTYACNGAVCGAWWNLDAPDYHQTPPGYALVDLHLDGRSQVQYLRY